jgi:hypothetical protein
MNRSLSLRLLLAVGLLSQASCTERLTAPATSENLPVAVQTRSPSVGEVVPAVRVSGGMGYVAVSVTRAAAGCATVSAGVSRGTNELAVVAHVTPKAPNPAALCAAVLPNLVVDYSGIINSVGAGTYRVRVFEGLADGAPTLIGSATVSVAQPYGQL